MNRQERRSKASLRAKLLRHNPEFNKFKEIDLENCIEVPPGCTKAFENSQYIVTQYTESTSKGNAIKLMIQKKDDSIPPNQFSDLQKIKNEILGVNAIAIQYFPPKLDLIDRYNIYWLYCFDRSQLPIPTTITDCLA